MNIGIIDLDTSHPASWIPVERDLGHTPAMIWDGGSVHPANYVKAFACEQDIPLAGNLEELISAVDGVIIHGCDWDTHVAKARPFIEAGKAVLIDKPFAGNRRDLETILQWTREGARITGGSSLPFCNELLAWQALPEEERGIPHTAIVGCAVDEFNYGIHAYAFLSAILGSGIRSVRHLDDAGQRQIRIKWENGRTGYLFIGKLDAWIPFHATILTNKGVTQLQPVAADLYSAFLKATLPYLSGQTETPPLPIEHLIEAELAALAAKQSWEQGNAEVLLSDIAESTRYDGAAFAESYKAARYPETAPAASK